jgi:hypothetical protein
MAFFLAAGMGLSVLGLPVPTVKRLPYRAASWLGATLLIWMFNPLRLADFTWGRQLSSGTNMQKESAVKNLSRVGKKDITAKQLDGLRFAQSDLDSLNFENSSLKGADFSRAFLIEANFQQADVTDANFEGANLFGTKLETAIGLETARCDRYTILPAEFSCEQGSISREAQDNEDNEPSVDAQEAEIERRVKSRLRGRNL